MYFLHFYVLFHIIKAYSYLLSSTIYTMSFQDGFICSHCFVFMLNKHVFDNENAHTIQSTDVCLFLFLFVLFTFSFHYFYLLVALFRSKVVFIFSVPINKQNFENRKSCFSFYERTIKS